MELTVNEKSPKRNVTEESLVMVAWSGIETPLVGPIWLSREWKDAK